MIIMITYDHNSRLCLANKVKIKNSIKGFTLSFFLISISLYYITKFSSFIRYYNLEEKIRRGSAFTSQELDPIKFANFPSRSCVDLLYV
jgi:hypothetical protein